MKYRFAEDLKAIRTILGLSQMEIAKELGVQQMTVSLNENSKSVPSQRFLETTYEYAYKKGIRLNRLKEMLWNEELNEGENLLFHGAKGSIKGDISIAAGRDNNDFGKGFYAGESYIQAVSFVSGSSDSSVYMMAFDNTDLKCRRYGVDQEWMMTIAYYRGALEEYKEHPRILELVEKSKDCDYIIAPIADNRMFQIINSFIYGEITDEQCRHCLAATNLGMQYVFTSQRAADRLRLLERCYIPENERNDLLNVRTSEKRLGEDKVKLARIEYRGKGQYIDQILD